MIDDIDLRRWVLTALDWSPGLDASHIAVTVNDGAVTLGGHVDSYMDLYVARRAVRRVEGVKAVAIDIEVRLPNTHKRDDSDIAESIAHVLRSNVSPAERDVRAEVRGGDVTLHGKVDWHAQRQHVERQVAHVTGVRSIYNQITLREHARPEDVKERIEAAFERDADLEANRISVEVDGDTVTLGGRVRAYHERGIAETAAWSAPGVRKVVDEIRVG